MDISRAFKSPRDTFCPEGVSQRWVTQTDSSAGIAPISQLLSYQLWEAQPHLLHISLFTQDTFRSLLPMAPSQTQFMEQEHCFPQLPEVACMKSDTSHVHLHSNEIRPGVENEGQREKIWERALQIRDGCFCLDWYQAA